MNFHDRSQFAPLTSLKNTPPFSSDQPISSPRRPGKKSQRHQAELTIDGGESEVAQMADIKGFDVDVSPDALGREGRAPVPAEGTLLLPRKGETGLTTLVCTV